MTVECCRTIHFEVDVDCDGDISITTTGGYHGEDVSREFTIYEMQAIVTRAKAHNEAYEAYRVRGYEDEEQYHADYERLCGDVGVENLV